MKNNKHFVSVPYSLCAYDVVLVRILAKTDQHMELSFVNLSFKNERENFVMCTRQIRHRPIRFTCMAFLHCRFFVISLVFGQ